jgi:hypothetical protein
VANGTLQINLNPPYLCFVSNEDRTRVASEDCSVEQIRQFLIELDIITPHDDLSHRDMQVLVAGVFSSATLAKYGLELGAEKSSPEAHGLRRLIPAH